MTLKPPVGINLPQSSRVDVLFEAPLNVQYPEFGASPDASAAQNLAAVRAAVAKLPATGGDVFIPRGLYDIAATAGGISPQGNGARLVGEGERASVLRPTHSSGYLIDISGTGFHRLEGFGIDGTLVTGTGQAIRFGAGTSRNVVEDVQISNFLNNGLQFTTVLEGSLDNLFINVDFESNSSHLRLKDDDAHAYPSNQNDFYACKFQYGDWEAGDALLIGDSEGNLFDGCLFQGNKTIRTINVTNSAAGSAPARSNVFRACWLEENGNGQAGSHGFHIVGTNSTTLAVRSTVIRDCKMLSSAQDHPSTQVFLSNAYRTVLDGNYQNLGSPNEFVRHSVGAAATRFGANDAAGDVINAAGAVVALPIYAEMT